MRESETRAERSFLVQCIWCGARIRERKEEETNGVCLKCFYDILSNHLQAQRQTVFGEFVSDR